MNKWKQMHPVARLLITWFLGYFGVHKFLQGDIKKGFLYLFTVGLFGFGWIYDIVVETVNVIKFYKSGGKMTKYNTASEIFYTLDYKSPSGGYMNYAEFEVVGIKSSTKRRNTRHYSCKYEEEAAAMAAKEGITEIISINPVYFRAPSEAQYAACRKHNRKIPQGACIMDVSALMTKDIEGEKPASVELMKYADSLGLHFSYLTGEQSLRNLINGDNY